MATRVKSVAATDTHLISGLSRVLIDVVEGGASVGFLAPLSQADADAYWRETFDAIGSSERRLWIAEVDGVVAGSVQLDPSPKQNGRHRAEIMKLIVHRDFRGRGISSALMREAESAAREMGRTLLVLDTEAGSRAEEVYKHLGWTPCGGVPGYALSTAGVPRANAYYFKELP